MLTACIQFLLSNSPRTGVNRRKCKCKCQCNCSCAAAAVAHATDVASAAPSVGTRSAPRTKSRRPRMRSLGQ
eukprot:6923675-Alexandrium_andersonii.AAC.1